MLGIALAFTAIEVTCYFRCDSRRYRRHARCWSV